MQDSRGEFSQPANLKIPTRLLAPRGHFKPTISFCEIIQWMLAFPDALFSGTETLRAARVDEIMQHFLLNGDLREMYPGGCRKRICQNLARKARSPCPIADRSRREPTLSKTTVVTINSSSTHLGCLRQ